MRRVWLVVVIGALLGARGLAQSQTPTLSDLDPMKRALLEPVMALHYGDQIGLSKSQRASIDEDLRQAKAQFSEIQAQLDREMSHLNGLLEAPELQEQEAIAQLDRVLNLERAIKRVNLLCALRVRAQLTRAQREKLRTLELPPPPPPPPPPPAPPPPKVTIPHRP
jgi:Spy/CpxP family protein refolding chaperone